MKDEDDCTPCRVVGSVVLLGTGGYFGIESWRNAKTNRYVFGALSAVFLSLGVYRAATPARPIDPFKKH